MEILFFFLVIELTFSKGFTFEKTRYRLSPLAITKLDENREDFEPSTVEDSRLVHVDDDILVFEKPANLLCAPGLKDKYNLASYVAELYNIPRVDHMLVHRIDYATSGLIVFARHEKALVELHRRFRERNRIYKRYTAVVQGILPTLEGEIDLPIGRDLIRGPPYFSIAVEHGKQSLTNWHVMGRSANSTYVYLYPHTGRTHQLRLHMAAIGHPILGDYFYAPADSFAAASRLMLHAASLGIVHPITKKEMLFEASCPLKDMM